MRVAAEGAVRENIFDNEEPGRGAGRLARRGAAPGGTSARAEHDHVIPSLLHSLQFIVTCHIKNPRSSE